MKRYKYQRNITDQVFQASFELALYLKDYLDFHVITYADDPKYVDLLHYENPHAQKMEFRRRGVKIRFDYIDIQVSYGTREIWDGYRINQFFLIQLHYLGGLTDYQKKKFMTDLEQSGMNQSYSDYIAIK